MLLNNFLLIFNTILKIFLYYIHRNNFTIGLFTHQSSYSIPMKVIILMNYYEIVIKFIL